MGALEGVERLHEVAVPRQELSAAVDVVLLVEHVREGEVEVAPQRREGGAGAVAVERDADGVGHIREPEEGVGVTAPASGQTSHDRAIGRCRALLEAHA